MDEQTHVPNAMELPSTRQLNRATLIAAGVASVILVTTILPAEYGIDPTGVGSVLGLTPMGEMKRQQANADVEGTAAATAETGDILMDEQTSPASASSSATSAGAGSVTLTLAPNAGTEVKATMRAGDEIRYDWSTGGPQVNFELHGEETGASGDDYTSYERGTSAGASGTFRAPFDGTHGWYWRNKTGAPVTITVRAAGAFSKFEQLH